MFDITKESPLSLAEAAALLPRGRNGARPHISTLVRWIESGVRTPSGEVVRLDGVRLGSKWITSREALVRFTQQLTPSLDRKPAETPRSPTARQRASERAARELEKMGI